MTPTDRLIQFYETLQPADLDRLAELYAPDARFKDPFNDVSGLPAIRAVFEHMFRRLDGPRFVVTGRLADEAQAVLRWDFVFRWPGEREAVTIRGVTWFEFDAQGRVSLHRDHWDAAEELYERLPLLGPLMRWLKRRVQRG